MSPCSRRIFDRQPSALGVCKLKPSRPHLFSQDPILLEQVLDDGLLLLVQPSGQDDAHQLQWKSVRISCRKAIQNRPSQQPGHVGRVNAAHGREVNHFGIRDDRHMSRETRRVLDSLGIKIEDLDSRVENLSGRQRQSIAIGRAVYFQARTLIMDEPSAALGVEEAELVVTLIEELKAKGIGIFFISHDIHDVYRIIDRI